MFNFRSFLVTVSIFVVCINIVIASSGNVCAASSTLLLNEVQTAAVSDSGLEFIEIYNAGISDMSLEDMRLAYRSASGERDTTLYRFTENDVISSHGFFLLVHSGKSVGRTADAIFTTGLANSGGGLAIRGSDNQILDSMGWGTASNIFVEGTAAAAPGAGSSLERLIALDTDDNARDFRIQDLPDPKNSTDSSEVPIPQTFFHFAASVLALVFARIRLLL